MALARFDNYHDKSENRFAV